MSELRFVPLLRELTVQFHPHRRGWLDAQEISQVEKILHLDEMTLIELRNMRDMAVMFFEDMDVISGVTSVIDRHIFNMGGEV